MHWAEQYVGMPYVPGENDCAAFAVKVMSEIFGRLISLPAAQGESVAGWSRQITQHHDDYATKTDHPLEGDAVLMIGRGRLSHIGIYVLINNIPYVLHATRHAGQVCLHAIRDLDKQGLQLEGYYRWK